MAGATGLQSMKTQVGCEKSGTGCWALGSRPAGPIYSPSLERSSTPCGMLHHEGSPADWTCAARLYRRSWGCAGVGCPRIGARVAQEAMPPSLHPGALQVVVHLSPNLQPVGSGSHVSSLNGDIFMLLGKFFFSFISSPPFF